MSAFIARQPNGRLCRFSRIVDCLTHYNLTDKDYLNNVTGTIESREAAAFTIRHELVDFSEVLDLFAETEMSHHEFNQICTQMHAPVTRKTKWVAT